MAKVKVLVIGQGEIGKPLAEIMASCYQTIVKDTENLDIQETVDAMHVCYPYQVDDFVGTTVAYIAQYQPTLTIIHSTVLPGTTRAVQEKSQRAVVYSAVRGKHANMKQDLLSYTKYVGGVSPDTTSAAMEHLKGAGMKVEPFSSSDALELAKLLETTYFGVLIGWAQEMERFAQCLDVDYYEVMRFTKEIDYLPSVVFRPGFIGGHCVMPNIELLRSISDSVMLDAIKRSNEMKSQQLIKNREEPVERLTPVNSNPSPEEPTS